MFTTVAMTILMLFCAAHTAAAQGTSAAEAEQEKQDPWLGIAVRMYGAADSHVPADGDVDALTATLPETVRILRAADVQLSVLVCQHWESDDQSDPCARVLNPREFAIRTYRSSALTTHTTGDHRLASSLLDFSSGRGSLITVDVSAIEWLAGVSGSDPKLLFERVIAHELGHMLVGSAAHGKTGLMRAVWSNEELRRRRPQDWAFTSRQMVAIHSRRHTSSHAAVRSASLLARTRK